MTEKFGNATLKTLDNVSLAVNVRGYISPTLGWMLVPGDEHLELKAFQNYLLEINDSLIEICLTKVARTLMVPIDNLSIDFRVERRWSRWLAVLYERVAPDWALTNCITDCDVVRVSGSSEDLAEIKWKL